MVEGNLHQLLNQSRGVIIACSVAIIGTLLILKLVDLTVGLRVSQEQETHGMDLSQHGEDGRLLRGFRQRFARQEFADFVGCT